MASVARNYAEALLALATKADNREGFGVMIRDVAHAVRSHETLRLFLESPRVSAAHKNAVIGKAFADRVPRVFLRFLYTLVNNRRQLLIPQIADEYMSLFDAAEGRVHAEVTVATAMSETEIQALAQRLSALIGKTVVPHMVVDSAIMGGLVVKIGDTVMDGSVRRRLGTLARRMRETRVSEARVSASA
jgi:F-type H+-transporting ATPase subunit delta